MDDSDELLKRALGYPYATPEESFALSEGRIGAFDRDGSELAAREALVAYGSNAAPEVLARKLGAATESVLARRAVLPGFDVVYSAHFSPYGSVPATLLASPGTEVSAFVLYLTAAQLRAIAATEPNYELTRSAGLECRFEDGGELSAPPVYLSRHGALRIDGAAVALAAIPAAGRRLAAMSEPEILERLRAMLAPERSLERFVLDACADPAIAAERTRLLRPS